MSAVQDDRAQSIRQPGEQAGPQQPEGASAADAPHPMPDELLHELRVHQVELERQNEALRNVQLSLEEARDRYVDLFEFAPVGYLTLTRQGTIDEINLTATKLLGAERKQVLGHRFAHFVLPEDRDRWHVYFVDIAKHSDSRDCELRLLRGEGPPFYARVNGIGVTSTAGGVAVRITLTDISEQKRMEALNESELRLRKRAAEDQKRAAERIKQLGLHLETLREQQSAMIARELHDELGATLTMLKLGLAIAAEEVASAEPLRTKFAGLLEQADAALRVVKRVSSSLRPATLDTLGLIATIRWYVTQFSRNTGIATTLRLPEYVRLSQPGNTTVFRIIQEGLTNVAKHSGASKVTINVRKHDGALIVRLIDNGSGITESDLQRQDSFGLMGMRERAEHLGGTLSIGSRPDKGTQLMLRIPLDS